MTPPRLIGEPLWYQASVSAVTPGAALESCADAGEAIAATSTKRTANLTAVFLMSNAPERIILFSANSAQAPARNSGDCRRAHRVPLLARRRPAGAPASFHRR